MKINILDHISRNHPASLTAKNAGLEIGEVVKATSGPFSDEPCIVTSGPDDVVPVYNPRFPATFYWRCAPHQVKKFYQ